MGRSNAWLHMKGNSLSWDILLSISFLCVATLIDMGGANESLAQTKDSTLHYSARPHLLSSTHAGPFESEAGQKSRLRIAASYRKVPLTFERNEGQTDSRVKFLSQGRGYTLFLTDGEAVLKLSSRKNRRRRRESLRAGPYASQAQRDPVKGLPSVIFSSPPVSLLSPGQVGSTNPPGLLPSLSALVQATGLPTGSIPSPTNPLRITESSTTLRMKLVGALGGRQP
jgi:hypothetical protein